MKHMTKVWILLSFLVISPTISFIGWSLDNKLLILGGGIVGLLSLFMVLKLIKDDDNPNIKTILDVQQANKVSRYNQEDRI